MNNKRTFAAVQRHTIYSPNHIGNDAAIFNAVAERLMRAGHYVHFYTEQEFLTKELSEHYIFNMIRSKEAVKRLQRYEEDGCIAVNSGFGIENCTREKMTRLLLDAGVPHPHSLFLLVSEKNFSNLPMPCWVKRADFHAIHKEDVSYVRNEEEFRSLLSEYALRGIERVVVNEHLEGDLIKFYGVNGTDFFYWFYPFEMKHSKFGLEKINGEPTGISFDVETLQRICNQAASVLNVDVYGGDAIVAADGSMRIIDFNDWPSFAPCREEAADAISEIILKKSV